MRLDGSLDGPVGFYAGHNGAQQAVLRKKVTEEVRNATALHLTEILSFRLWPTWSRIVSSLL